MDASLVKYSLVDQVALIELDDGKANVLSPDMLASIHSALDKAQEEAKAICIRGREGRFSAGFDLKVMMSGPKAAMEMVQGGCELFLRVYEFPLPVVVAVTGHAVAGGLMLATAGDLRIGVDGDFKLGLNEIKNGMPVPILFHELARDRVLASELVPSVLYSKTYSPQQAAQAGWLDRCVAPEALEEEAMSAAKQLTQLPGHVYAATKKSLRAQTISYVKSTLQDNLLAMTGQKPA